jgi:hypothetical protein
MSVLATLRSGNEVLAYSEGEVVESRDSNDPMVDWGVGFVSPEYSFGALENGVRTLRRQMEVLRDIGTSLVGVCDVSCHFGGGL